MPELILKLKDRELKRITINKSEFTIGRDPDNDLFIDNIGISRSHTKVRYQNGAFHVMDNGSSNGTFLNGNQIDTHPLKDNDEIQIGKYKVIFSSVGEIHDFIPTLDSSPTSDPNKKKVRNVFGTLQFSSDEIQNLMKSSDKSSAQQNNVSISVHDGTNNSLDNDSDSSNKSNIIIMLGVVVVVLLVVLIAVIALK